jgi:hypothetical protein
MSKMGSHDPFGYLKHKLWPKEGSGVKVPIWLPTTKSQKSPWFTCVQVACHISLENYQQGLQLCFKLHLNRKSAHKVMGLQSCRNPNSDNFRIPNLGISRQNDISVLAPWPCTKNTIRGKVLIFPKSRPWWVLLVRVCPWLIYAPKMFPTMHLTNLLFGLCKSMWIIIPLVTRLSPHLRALTRPSTPKCCEPGSIPQFFILLLFWHLHSQLSLSKSLGVRQYGFLPRI